MYILKEKMLKATINTRMLHLSPDAWKYPISVSKESVEKAKAIREMALRKRKAEVEGKLIFGLTYIKLSTFDLVCMRFGH